MSIDANGSQSPGRPPADVPILASNWFYVLFLGAAVSGLIAYVYDALFPAEVAALSGNLGPVALILVVGLAGSLAVATVSTGRLWRRADRLPGRPPWRRWGAWTAAAILVGAGSWGVVAALDHSRSRGVSADIVGTWHDLFPDGTPYSEKTFHPDETYEYRRLTGPENERGVHRGAYEISSDGRSINFYDLPKTPRQLPDGTPIWDNAITFSDRDHFVVEERSWHHHARTSYRRVR